MIVSGAFDYIDVLAKAADYSWKRQEVINNNIANVDTPGYKREDVAFSQYLQTKLGKNIVSTDDTPRSVDIKDIVSKLDDGVLDYRVYKDYDGWSYRLDGNNVDIDTENVELASNQLLYNGIIGSISSEFSRISTVLGKK